MPNLVLFFKTEPGTERLILGAAADPVKELPATRTADGIGPLMANMCGIRSHGGRSLRSKFREANPDADPS